MMRWWLCSLVGLLALSLYACEEDAVVKPQAPATTDGGNGGSAGNAEGGAKSVGGAGGLGGAGGAVGGFGPGETCDTRMDVYVADAVGGVVQGFSFSAGAFSTITGSPFVTAAPVSHVAVGRAGTRAYASSATTFELFGFDRLTDGRLSPLNSSPFTTAKQPRYVAMGENDGCLFMPSLTDDTMPQYRVEVDGSLTHTSTWNYMELAGPIEVDELNDAIYVVERGNNGMGSLTRMNVDESCVNGVSPADGYASPSSVTLNDDGSCALLATNEGIVAFDLAVAWFMAEVGVYQPNTDFDEVRFVPGGRYILTEDAAGNMAVVEMTPGSCLPAGGPLTTQTVAAGAWAVDVLRDAGGDHTLMLIDQSSAELVAMTIDDAGAVSEADRITVAAGANGVDVICAP